MRALLCIGGMDSSGGAGLLADQASALAFGVDIRAAVTAVTAQDRGPDGGGVTAIHPVPADVLRGQIRAANGVSAVKIGMLAQARLVRVVAETLPAVPMVLDPVLAASSGRALLTEKGLSTLCEVLLPRADLVTPNLPELDILAAKLGCRAPDTKAKAEAILRAGAGAVLVKGGHGTGAKSVDLLYSQNGAPERFAAPRLAQSHPGTGCRLASAIAAGLAKGEALAPAIRAAKAHVHEGIAQGARPGV